MGFRLTRPVTFNIWLCSCLVMGSVFVNSYSYTAGAQPQKYSVEIPEQKLRTLLPFERKPVPPVSIARTDLSYHAITFDFNDPRSKEPLVKLKDFGIEGECFYARTDKQNAPYYECVCKGNAGAYSRKGIALKLAEVNKTLAPYGYELYVLDAYRPVSCQRALWNYFIQRAKQVLKSPTEAECINFAGKYCSDPRKFDPKDQLTWPTHSTGGAVDLTLRRLKSGELAYMGGVFDDASVQSKSTYYEGRNDEEMSASDIEARRNRRILYWAMVSHGFVNYIAEWWHYDFGTQLWAKNAAWFMEISRTVTGGANGGAAPASSKTSSPDARAFYGTMAEPN